MADLGTREAAGPQRCECGRPVRPASNTPYGWEHADTEPGEVICEDGWYDPDTEIWHEPVFAELAEGCTG